MQAVARPLAARICTVGARRQMREWRPTGLGACPKARRRTVAPHQVRPLLKDGHVLRVYNVGTSRMGVHQVLKRWGMRFF